MKLLIITQVVDTEDSFLGFFVRWIEEFAKHVEHVEVVCLKEGRHTLSGNVQVHSLGKERGESRVKYVFNFYKYIWGLRHNYDTVFVHMNPEYVILGGLFWRAWGKRVALWYTHKSVDMRLRCAALLSNTIFTASKESFRLRSPKVRVMGHGIDVDFFSPDVRVVRGDSVLSIGRLMKSKRHDLIIRAAALAGRELRIVGDGPERENLEVLARAVGAHVLFLGGLAQSQLRDEYRQAALFIHASETGSLDKVVLEALACGLPVLTTSTSLRGLPVTVVERTPDALAEAVRTFSHPNTQALATYVREQHSLQKLIPAIVTAMQNI